MEFVLVMLLDLGLDGVYLAIESPRHGGCGEWRYESKGIGGWNGVPQQ